MIATVTIGFIVTVAIVLLNLYVDVVVAFIISLSECFRFLACGSKIFFITCHCFSVRSVGYCVITLLFGTFKDITFFQLTD